ncbi:hypothetical protein SMA01_1144 [Salmonella enterica subsp. enterica serovar Manhattan str. 111113]|nr:hypothetical protein LTSEJOH_1376 [Salmonella enterica subsp. enterica serovar Johannesburg str. S5-703]CEH20935.1 hypothetical protein SMA01_1144 [Salmonella enterica subsp. enterica serovar Manhattan str. 111113]
MSLIVSIDNPVSSLYFSIEIEGTANDIEILGFMVHDSLFLD